MVPRPAVDKQAYIAVSAEIELDQNRHVNERPQTVVWDSDTVSAADVVDAFTRVRLTAEDYMNERDLAGLGWVEESVTDIAMHKGLPQVRLVPYNRKQEGGGIGADYLWWWLDEASGECFGMLVQAKRLHQQGKRWTVDISHRSGGQLRDLARTASHLEVPAMYGVYTGGQVFRRDLPCSHNSHKKDDPDCVACRRMAISLISAYQVWAGWKSPVDTATTVLNKSIPLEDLVDPALGAGKVVDLNLLNNGIGPGQLRDFLLDEQQGPREIAKRIFKVVVAARMLSLSAALAEPMTIAGKPIFRVVPTDTGHYPGSYFNHFLRGLRMSPPQYVLDLQEGQPAPRDVSSRVASVILVSV